MRGVRLAYDGRQGEADMAHAALDRAIIATEGTRKNPKHVNWVGIFRGPILKLAQELWQVFTMPECPRSGGQERTSTDQAWYGVKKHMG